MSDAARAIRSEIDAEKAKPKKNYPLLKSLKAEFEAQLVKDAKVQELSAALAAAVDEEDFDRCEELETQLEAAKVEAERGGAGQGGARGAGAGGCGGRGEGSSGGGDGVAGLRGAGRG